MILQMQLVSAIGRKLLVLFGLFRVVEHGVLLLLSIQLRDLVIASDYSGEEATVQWTYQALATRTSCRISHLGNRFDKFSLSDLKPNVLFFHLSLILWNFPL